MTSSAVFPWNAKSHGPPNCLHVIVFIRLASFHGMWPLQIGRVKRMRDLVSASRRAVEHECMADGSVQPLHHRSTHPSRASPILPDVHSGPSSGAPTELVSQPTQRRRSAAINGELLRTHTRQARVR